MSMYFCVSVCVLRKKENWKQHPDFLSGLEPKKEGANSTLE